MKNTLYFGDNLDVAAVRRRRIGRLGLSRPAFQVNQNYNVLFLRKTVRSAAQIQAFEDTWRWTWRPKPPIKRLWRPGGKSHWPCRPFGPCLGSRIRLPTFR